MRTVQFRTPARQSAYRQPSLQRRHRPDYILILLSLSLLAIGLITVYAISPGLAAQLPDISEGYYVRKHIIAVLLGITAFLIFAAVPYQNWARYEKPLIVSAVIAAIVVRLFAEPIYGAYRWIHIGGLSFQAVELIKLALLVWLSTFLANRLRNRSLDDSQSTVKPLMTALVLIIAVVAFVQSDLGSTGVLMVMMGAMVFVAGLPMRRLIMIAGIILLATILAISLSAYRRDRIMTYLNPERDCQTTGYQACQALITVGSGGLFGKGLAQGVQAYGYLPEAANDSIFAIMAEKYGFFGVTLIICLFVGLFSRMVRIIERAPDNFSRFLVVGILAWLSTQMMINVGAMVGLLPLKGITLPFISYGGTSIIFVSVAMGIVFNISRYTSFAVNMDNVSNGKGSYENTAYGRRDRRPYYPDISRRA